MIFALAQFRQEKGVRLANEVPQGIDRFSQAREERIRSGLNRERIQLIQQRFERFAGLLAQGSGFGRAAL